ncbi:bifunctional AP-4-A phosphorylase/ADP sulfurylase, partial [Coemansia sp. RSA 518]
HGLRWSLIEDCHGTNGTIDQVLRGRNRVNLKDKARTIKLRLMRANNVYKHREQGVVFEVRYVPALAKKPNSKPREKQHAKDFVNPFLPYDERLHVKQIGNTHHLLLNKYCVVPHHLLITTAEFRQQGEPLSEADFTAVLETIDNLSSRNIVFYNSGEESGA